MTEQCCGGGETESPQAGQELVIRLDADKKVISVTINGHALNLDQPLELLFDGGAVSKQVRSEPLTRPAKSDEPDHRERLFLHSRNTVITFFVVLLVEFLIARWDVMGVSPLAERYGLWILYLDVSVVALMATVFYMRSYVYGRVTHMVGMLIGMTIGMQVGTMVGGVIGATNGFFLGAMIGMGLGSLSGVITAWCCGAMAVLHALMSGVMGGTMGAMVVVMMMPDHVLVFMPVFTALNILILICFTYIFYRECVLDDQCVSRHSLSLLPLLATCLLMTLGLSFLIIAGPKGPMASEERPLSMDAGTSNPFSLEGHDHSGSRHMPEMGCGASMGGHKH